MNHLLSKQEKDVQGYSTPAACGSTCFSLCTSSCAQGCNSACTAWYFWGIAQ